MSMTYLRCEMGPFSQLHCGDYVLKHGGSAGKFALHMDGTSSEGRELSAFVIGHRSTSDDGVSRINNLLMDISWAMDKTAATRASDFRTICAGMADLCKKAGMLETDRLKDLQPSATMTDRANAERCLMGSDVVNPTCGEHGAVVNPTTACTKAMDHVVQAWMGKSEADAKLDEHKVRALHMAVGWNSSPCGALIYCTCKYGAAFSDKGYAVGQEARAYNEYLARLSPDDRESILLLGHMEDLLSIKGSRSYVGMLNAPVVDRILTDGPGSFYRFLKEQEDLAQPGGGRIRKQIIAGVESAEVRAYACALRPSLGTSSCGRCCEPSSTGCPMVQTLISWTWRPSTKRHSSNSRQQLHPHVWQACATHELAPSQHRTRLNGAEYTLTSGGHESIEASPFLSRHVSQHRCRRMHKGQANQDGYGPHL